MGFWLKKNLIDGCIYVRLKAKWNLSNLSVKRETRRRLPYRGVSLSDWINNYLYNCKLPANRHSGQETGFNKFSLPFSPPNKKNGDKRQGSKPAGLGTRHNFSAHVNTSQHETWKLERNILIAIIHQLNKPKAISKINTPLSPFFTSHSPALVCPTYGGAGIELG